MGHHAQAADGSLVEKSCGTVSNGAGGVDLTIVDAVETTYLIHYGARLPNPDEDPESIFPADYGELRTLGLLSTRQMVVALASC